MNKYRINYTNSKRKRSNFTCSAFDPIHALEKLKKSRAFYGECFSNLKNIVIKTLVQKHT